MKIKQIKIKSGINTNKNKKILFYPLYHVKMKKTYILCNSNGDVLNLCNSKKQVKTRINEKIKDELKIYGCILNGKIKDYEIRSIKYNSKKYYLDLSFYDLFLIDRKTQEPIEYDEYKNHGIFDKKEKKDFLYLKNN